MAWERLKERELGCSGRRADGSGGIDGLGGTDLKLELTCAEIPKEGLGNVPLNLDLACAKLPESEA
uniref:Uncharacterized protein n=2 Tax=Oryza TaxID=4527 RepID=Q6ZLH5_ORYSJ|nr:hypothetical protein [Oryza sativa Japonica Group]